VLTWTHHSYLSWAREVQAMSGHPIPARSIFISPSHLRLCLARIFVIQVSSPNSVNISPPSRTWSTLRPSHPSSFHHPYHFWQEAQVMKFFIRKFSPSACRFLIQDPNIFHSTCSTTTSPPVLSLILTLPSKRGHWKTEWRIEVIVTTRKKA